jgi:hypothetical protein
MSVNPAALLHLDDEGRAWLEWTTSESAVPLDPHVVDAITQDGSLSHGAAPGVPEDVRASLQPRGAQSMSGYHAATRDHPFLDMSRGMDARVEDAKIMARYVEGDEYPSVYLDLPSTAMHAMERATDLDLDPLRNSDWNQLAAILGGVFGQTHRQPAYYDPETGYHQVELIFRSVPSAVERVIRPNALWRSCAPRRSRLDTITSTPERMRSLLSPACRQMRRARR